MLDKLNQLVRENVQDSVIENKDIPNEKNEDVVNAASGSILETLKAQVSSGNLNNLTKMFTGGGTEEHGNLIQQATSTFSNKLSGLGISGDKAQQLGASIIPLIIGKLTNKTADTNDQSFNFQDLIGNLGGGKLDLGGIAEKFTGGNEKTDKSDNEGEGNGLIDKIKGLF